MKFAYIVFISCFIAAMILISLCMAMEMILVAPNVMKLIITILIVACLGVLFGLIDIFYNNKKKVGLKMDFTKNIPLTAFAAAVFLADTIWAASRDIGIFAPIIYGCTFLVLMIIEVRHG